MFKTVRENLTIHQFVSDGNGIAADITTQFTTIEVAPNFVVGALRKRERIRGRVFVQTREEIAGNAARVRWAKERKKKQPSI
jgi:hypothetical protein